MWRKENILYLRGINPRFLGFPACSLVTTLDDPSRLFSFNCRTTSVALRLFPWDNTPGELVFKQDQHDATLHNGITIMRYMFQAFPPPIIRSLKLHTEHRVFFEIFLLLTATQGRIKLFGAPRQ